MNFRAKIESLENELGKLKTERMSYYVERRQLERKLEVKNDELEDLKRELGFSKDPEAKAIKRYKRALEYNIEVEAEVAELKTRFEQERGQLLDRLIHFKEKLAERVSRSDNGTYQRELELANLRGKMMAPCRELEADLASKRQVNDVKCSLKSRKRKEFAKPRAFSERKLVGENGVVCDRKRKFPAYIQKTETGDVSSNASNHSDDTFTDASDHEQDAEQTTILIILETPSGKLIGMRVEPSLTIGGLKFKILNKEGIRSDLQRLCFAGKELEDSRTLAHYNIKSYSIIQLMVELIVDVKT
ncbi:uncharacterized protein LOC141599211 isoform X2 [Silene latifolia]|uniref:uncharacterized protein LOC141599211 isoform X2 n=1 Tax=Silene latifolia TaxID=37657 RepID=UPI003D76BF7D